jgi:hypothetical protein
MSKENYARCVSRNVQFAAEGYFTHWDLNFPGATFPRCYLTHELRTSSSYKNLFHPVKNTSTVPFSFSDAARWLWHYRPMIAAVCID